MDAPQLEFDFSSSQVNPGRVVMARKHDLGSFGNLHHVIVVDGSTVRDVSLLECDDFNVEYYNGQSELPEDYDNA